MANAKTTALSKKQSGKKYLASRVKSLRHELHKERLSYGEIAEMGKYKKHFQRTGDVEMAEAAGIPEEEFNRHRK